MPQKCLGVGGLLFSHHVGQRHIGNLSNDAAYVGPTLPQKGGQLLDLGSSALPIAGLQIQVDRPFDSL